MSLQCCECNEQIKTSQDVIFCSGGCENIFCNKCSKLKKTDIKVISDNRNIKWFCNLCEINNVQSMFVEVKQLIKNINESKLTVKDIEETVKQCVKSELIKMKRNYLDNLQINIREDMQTECDKMKNEISKKIGDDMDKRTNEIIINSKKSTSYAQVLQNNEKKIIMKPKNKEMGNREIKQKLKNVIEPTQCLIKQVKELNSGGIIIECSSKEACDEIQKELNEKMGQECNVDGVKTTSNKKYFKLIGLTSDIGEDRITECLKKQNDCCEQKEFKIVKKYINNNIRKENYNAIIETDVDTYEKIMEIKRLKIEYDICRVFACEQTIMRCYKCLGFGHKATGCINQKACGKCSGNHEMKDCTSTEIICVNCKELKKKKLIDTEIDHYAFSRLCPAIKKFLDSRQNKNK